MKELKSVTNTTQSTTDPFSVAPKKEVEQSNEKMTLPNLIVTPGVPPIESRETEVVKYPGIENLDNLTQTGDINTAQTEASDPTATASDSSTVAEDPSLPGANIERLKNEINELSEQIMQFKDENENNLSINEEAALGALVANLIYPLGWIEGNKEQRTPNEAQLSAEKFVPKLQTLSKLL